MADTFIYGSEPGGLRTQGEIKIFICFLLECAGGIMSMSQIAETTQVCGAANYFEVGQAVSELINTGGIKEFAENETDTQNEKDEDERLLELSDEGRSCVKTLKNELPLSLRDKAEFAVKKIITRARTEKENNIIIEQTVGGYFVTLEVNDRQLELMSLKLLVSDFEAASKIKEDFLNDPVKIYQSVIQVFAEEKQQ